MPLGVDLDQFHPQPPLRDGAAAVGPPGQTLLVHCGRLSVEKHAHRSIDTVAALRDSGVDARLVVVGEGPMRARLERQAARLPVDFTGYIGCRDTVATILATADVALAPGPHETFGLAALEALACGTPAVVSRTSALAEILTTDSGAAADNDPHAIARRGDVDHQPAGTPAPQQRAPPRRAVHLAQVGRRNAQRTGRGLGDGRATGLPCPDGWPRIGPADTERARSLWFALLLTLANGFLDAHTYYRPRRGVRQRPDRQRDLLRHRRLRSGSGRGAGPRLADPGVHRRRGAGLAHQVRPRRTHRAAPAALDDGRPGRRARRSSASSRHRCRTAM